MIKLKQRGFTIIELLIATVIFAVILLVISGAIVQFGRIYYKGVIGSKTQDVATTIVRDITQSIQFQTGSIPPSDSANGIFCAGNRRYSFKEGIQLSDSQHVLIADTKDGCLSTGARSLTDPIGTDPTGGKNPTELIGAGMRLAKLRVVENPANSGLYEITVRVVYGDDDLLDSSKTNCETSIRTGGQYCAVSELKTTASRRRSE